MLLKVVEEAYSKLFGAPLDGSRIDQDQAFCLINGNHTAADLAQMTAEECARLIADSPSLVNRHARNLAEIFDSSSASETGAALPLISAGDSLAPPLHSILTVSVDINQHDRMAYLGSPVESLASGQTE
jgi:hypothetical protein